MSRWSATKASRVLAALKRIGWVEARSKGSHRRLERDGWKAYTFSFHDGDEIGTGMLSKVGISRSK